jgi:hypothetical protein
MAFSTWRRSRPDSSTCAEEDGKSVLELIGSDHASIELIRTDVVMKGMNGPELVWRLIDSHLAKSCGYVGLYPRTRRAPGSGQRHPAAGETVHPRRPAEDDRRGAGVGNLSRPAGQLDCRVPRHSCPRLRPAQEKPELRGAFDSLLCSSWLSSRLPTEPRAWSRFRGQGVPAPRNLISL